jgi:hypothetical protein
MLPADEESGKQGMRSPCWKQQYNSRPGILHHTATNMIFRLAADAVLSIHLAFILFALLGAAIAVRWRWIPVVHLPVAAWGIFVELTGRICPLTYLENYLRIKGGLSGYTESFVEHYLLAIIYSAGLTREIQFALAAVVIVVNIAIYGWLFARKRRL